MNSDARLSLVDIAHEIIAMHEENFALRRENAMLMDTVQMYTKGTQDTIDSSRRMIGQLLVAVLDPKSVICRGLDVIERERNQESP